MKPKSAKTESITFLAAFPDIQGQLKVGRDGMRIALDVPESDLAAALRLVLWRDKVLRITVEPCITGQEHGYGQKRDNLATESKRKSRWTSTERQGTDGAPGESGQPHTNAS